MPMARSSRPPEKRTLKPAPSSSTYVQSSGTKSEVRFALPADQPQVEVVRIDTCAVSQPLLEPDALQRLR
ncbi:hypothetical protein NOR_01788 [Metarhizium rileyi]|uniref:Uncharacterized protein n=1 Tax=Metarhizium rileyi (strain RCEF 4871) TaxID=1649241 RepID=A0A162JSL0_METRR|nr:hypothetical protein NOR_01788 [Metarhizium rileyi RCEF 4871]TWU71597.1 hypothetical protein ED733_003096 [Metarhizium rileyi]